MARLTIEDLKKIKERHKAEFALREGGYKAKVTVHMGTCGAAAGAKDVMAALMDELGKSGRTDVFVTTSGCAGLCAREPLATVQVIGRPPVRYCDLTPDKMREIFKEHVIGGNPVERYALVMGSETTY